MKRSHIRIAIALALFWTAPAGIASAQQSAILEQGKFTLHKFEQAIGEESYEIRNQGDSIAVKMDFKFTDRATPVPLTASFRGAHDLTPETFEIKGKTARTASIDESISVENGKVHFRTRDKQSDLDPASGPFFTIAGYAPTTMQMLLVRYWATHGSPTKLETLPSGTVKVESRGQDTIKVGGREEKLDRYTVEGLIWGRETPLVRWQSPSGCGDLDRCRIRPFRGDSRRIRKRFGRLCGTSRC